jgi:SAM-dependent methyltransferase
MSDIKKETLDYFTKNAEAWVTDGYELAGYNYPTPYHRLRVLLKLITTLPNVKNVIDLGCGGGQISVELALRGFKVTGIDQSETMLNLAKKNALHASTETKSNLEFIKQDITTLDLKNVDCIVALGLAGYLPSDSELFVIASNNLKKGGFLIASFRNRLFNLSSVTKNICDDAKSGDFSKLVNEYKGCFDEKIDKLKVRDFLERLHAITGELLSNFLETEDTDLKPSERKNLNYEGVCSPRQSTPSDIESLANDAGFKLKQYFGIHPHIINPLLNKALPPTIYNKLSDSLLSFEQEKHALAWSSVFIGVFEKKF